MMQRLRRWLPRLMLVVPLVFLAAAVSLIGQSCPPKFKTSASTTSYYYVDSNDDDSYIYKQSGSSWDAAHDATSGTMDDSNVQIQIGVSNNYGGSGVWRVWRGFHVFDTSGLPDDAMILSATFYFYVDEVGCTTSTYQRMYLIGGSSSYPSEPNDAGDFDAAHYTWSPTGGLSNFITHDSLPTLTVDDWNTIPLSAQGLTYLNKTGNTRLATVVTYDVIDSEPSDGTRCYVDYASADSANDPYLAIEYVVEPTVTSSAATSVSFTTATANGNITSLGYDAHADYRGCVYGTSDAGDPGNVSPLYSGWGGYTVEIGEYGTGAFTCALNSLSQDQTYYYRTYCYTTWGFTYSTSAQSFHTLQLCSITTSAASSIMNTTARLPGNVTDTGYPTSVTVYVFWGDNDGGSTPGNWDYNAVPDSYPGGVAAFYKDISGLSPGGTYYFNARGNNGSGDVWAGTRSFVTQNTPPTVTTNAASSVINVSALLNGNIDSCGGDPTCSNYGFAWATSSHPADPGNTDPSASGYANNWKAAGSHGTGAISHSITTVARTTYYFRACAYNTAGWDYGGELSFTTCDKPDVSTQAVTDATLVGGTFHGTIIAVWGVNCDVYGFVRSTATHGDPGNTPPASSGYESQWTASGSFAPGAYTHTSVSCTAGTKYYIRFCAHNTYGWTYGTEVHFGTLPEDPTNLTMGGYTYTSIDLTWTEGAHAVKTMIRYETDSSTGTFPTGPTDGTEAYFNSDAACTVESLTPGETYYFAAWSWIEGSDVWSSGYSTVIVTLSVPPPVSLKAVPDDANTVNLWWIVPVGMRSVPTVSTILYGCVGTYPADPPDPPNPADFLVYTEITGDSGVHDYTWDNATAGTPYFFSVWFYDNFTDTYTTAVSALCTTPAGHNDPGMPGGNGFNPPDDSSMSGVPINDTMHKIADVWGMQHGFFWGLVVMLAAVLLTVGAVIATKSGLMATGVGGLILAVANTQDIVAVWVTIAFVFLGIVLSWVASHVYA